MKGKFRIGKFFGINLFIHWSFFLLILYAAWTSASGGGTLIDFVMNLALILVIFLCVTMHEYGHALAARGFGIPTKDIILLPIGGLARIESLGKTPGQELWIAVAGPLVNVVIGILIFAGFWLSGISPMFDTDNQGQYVIDLTRPDHFLYAVMFVNFLLVAFNMIPAFPMDGGRVFRSILAFFMKRHTATMIAVRVGQVAAAGFIIYGFAGGNFMLALIGFFVLMAAQSEARMTEPFRVLGKYKVSEVPRQDYRVVNPELTVWELGGMMTWDKTPVMVEYDGKWGYIDFSRLLPLLNRREYEKPAREIAVFEKPVNETESLEAVFMRMQEPETIMLPVSDGSKILGLITRSGLQNFYLQKIMKKQFSS